MFGKSKKKNDEEELPFELDRTMFVPRIKNVQFTAALKELNIPPDQLPHTEPLAGELLVTYAFDLPGLFQMATLADMDRVDIDPAEARKLAVDNLRRQIPEVRIGEHGVIRQIMIGDNLEACMLLADSFWDDMTGETDGDIVAAVPGRDYLFFCGSNSRDGLATLCGVIEEISDETDPKHLLTNELLTWRGGKWDEYED